MILQVLFVQRAEQHDGEYAPEALAVADEYTMDENPAWMDEQIEKQVLAHGKAFAGWQVLKIDLGKGSQEKIRRLLLGQHPALPGTLIEEDAS